MQIVYDGHLTNGDYDRLLALVRWALKQYQELALNGFVHINADRGIARMQFDRINDVMTRLINECAARNSNP